MGQTPSRKLRVRHTAALYTDLLSTGMYPPPAALWELVKNGWDAIKRLRDMLGSEDYEGRLQLRLVYNHPMSPRRYSLVIIDNGTGLDPTSLERFVTIGNRGEATTGITDQKRVGRIAAFALIDEKYRDKGFRVMSSTSSSGEVMLLDVTPEELAQNELTLSFISRDDTSLYGLCPSGSFTMIVIPYVVSSVSTSEKIERALEMYIPRYSAPNGFHLFIEDKEIEPPALEQDLVIHWSNKTGALKVYTGPSALAVQDPTNLGLGEGDIYGYFAKDGSRSPKGVRINDATTLTLVAQAKNMSAHVPFPLGRPELTGDLFIHGLMHNQNTDRAGLSPKFLASEEWRQVVDILLDHFSKPLGRLIGDEGVVRTDPMGKAMSQVLDGMRLVFGSPDAKVEIPSGINPPEEEGDEENGLTDGVPPSEPGESDPPGEPKPPRTPREPRPPQTGKVRPRRFMYKGITYVLGVSRQDPDQAAELNAPNVVLLNTRNQLVSNYLRKAPAALRLHVLESIIRVIERSLNELDPDSCDRAVQESLRAFYEKSA